MIHKPCLKVSQRAASSKNISRAANFGKLFDFCKVLNFAGSPPAAAVPNVSPQISSPRTVIFQSGTVFIQSRTVCALNLELFVSNLELCALKLGTVCIQSVLLRVNVVIDRVITCAHLLLIHNNYLPGSAKTAHRIAK